MIKICGLTRARDVSAAVALGADMLGFIHVPGSPRFVALERLAELLQLVPAGMTRVIVVQNCDASRLSVLRERLTFDRFQFHGDESPATIARFGGYKAVHVKAGETTCPRAGGDPFFLLDTQSDGQRGGTGKTFDWSIIPAIPGRFLVAGGLNPDNVGALIERYRPWGVDVSSGVESAPGHKDRVKLALFIENARRAWTP